MANVKIDLSNQNHPGQRGVSYVLYNSMQILSMVKRIKVTFLTFSSSAVPVRAFPLRDSSFPVQLSVSSLFRLSYPPCLKFK